MSKIPQNYLPGRECWPEYLNPKEFSSTPDKLNLADFLLDRHVREGRGDNAAIKFMDRAITYAQLQRMVNQFGNALKEAGVESQDRVGIRLVNSPSSLVTIFAIEKIGAIPVPTSPLWSREEIAFVVNDAEMRYFVVNEPLMEQVEAAKPKFLHGTRVIVIGGAAEEVKAAGNLVYEEMLAKGSPDLEATMLDGFDIGVILYTSGTTGMPKGCVHFVRPAVIETRIVNRYVYQLKPGDVLGGSAPVSFAAGFGTFTLIPFEGGAAVSLIPKFAPADMMELIGKHKITVLTGLPTAYRTLMKFPGFKSYDISSVRLYTSGGDCPRRGNTRGLGRTYRQAHMGRTRRDRNAAFGNFQHFEFRARTQLHRKSSSRGRGSSGGCRLQGVQTRRRGQYDNQRPFGHPLLEALRKQRKAAQVAEIERG